MKYKNKILYMILIVLMLSLVGCKDEETELGPDNPNTAEDNIQINEPLEGGMVSIPLTNFSTLNPILTDNSSYYHFSKLIFEGIFEFDDNLQPSLKLGQSYDISEDGKKILVKLKDNIKWHDGQELTASDVEFTIDVIKRAGIDSTYGKVFREAASIDENINLNKFINTKLIDNKNIEIIFDGEYANILEVLSFPIIPKHIFRNTDSALIMEDYKPIGTGPFKFTNYEKFKTVNLKRNPDYWNGPVYIEDIIGKVLDDNELILTSFETGQIDFAFSMDVDWDKYRQNERIQVYEYISSDYEFLGFSFKDENISKDQARAIKKAINYGIDRQNIIQSLYLGHGTQTDVPLHPKSYLIDEVSDKYGYNLTFAREELKNAGYIDRDGDGIVEDEDGKALSLSLLTNTYNPSRLRAGEIIVEDLIKMGIHSYLVEDRIKDGFVSQEEKDRQWTSIEDNMKKGNFDIALLGWKTSVIPNMAYMFHSSKVNETNFINYEDEAMDQILETSLSSSLDNKKQVYKNLQEYILEDLPYVSLFYKNQALLVDAKIKGELNPNFFNLYEGLEKCFIIKTGN